MSISYDCLGACYLPGWVIGKVIEKAVASKLQDSTYPLPAFCIPQNWASHQGMVRKQLIGPLDRKQALIARSL